MAFSINQVCRVANNATICSRKQRLAHKAANTFPDMFVETNYWDCFPNVRGTTLELTQVNAVQDQINATYEIFYDPYQKWFHVQSKTEDR